MTTATARRYLDADSHVLEPTDWLTPYADPGIRDRLRTLPHPIAPDHASAAAIVAGRAARSPDTDALADERLWGQGYAAYGAWDPAERSAVLDEFDIDGQLVFSTFAPGQFLSKPTRPPLRRDPRPHRGPWPTSVRPTPRLLAVPLIPFADVDRALEELDFALAQDPGAVLVPSTAPSKSMGPGHRRPRPDLGPAAGGGRCPSSPTWEQAGGWCPPATARTAGPFPPTSWGRREHPVEGLHQPRLLARELPVLPRPRRGLRTLPRDCGGRRSSRAPSGSRGCSRSSTGPCNSPAPSPTSPPCR